MDARLLATLLVCFLGTWTLAVQAQGAFEDCCLAYNHGLAWSKLRHARSYLCQPVSGSCNLPAVIFFLPRRILCGHPRDKTVQTAVKFLERRRNKSQGSHSRSRKLSHGSRSKVPTVNQGSCLLL